MELQGGYHGEAAAAQPRTGDVAAARRDGGHPFLEFFWKLFGNFWKIFGDFFGIWNFQKISKKKRHMSLGYSDGPGAQEVEETNKGATAPRMETHR